MKYCSNCGNLITQRIPEGDNRIRHVCDSCNTIHYQNPRVICGCIPVWEDKVLLCRRAIEPRKGFWTVPAGFMENGETLQQAAARETFEEAEARVNIGELYYVFSLPHINQVYLFFQGEVIDGKYGVGEESLESRLFEEHEIPWDELAFPTITDSLEAFFEDRKRGQFSLRVSDINFSRRS